ncbi:hypothetical protein O181_110331 [Austropuccinia psidii MF-1]|uniref:Reverse transcriptase Ty1/copia-type domain-containing protein n=1 Tax=Austropuccinia psidii MF-1 TaxID=1389203 RepID=A0A9Q3JYE1_9BASI|nr:hypothetical protein [Austropuccinia psidii MF-1]
MDGINTCISKLQQMKDWGLWQVIDSLPHHKVIGQQWAFTQKASPDCIVIKHKAWFWDCGDLQPPGIECSETYMPTTSLVSLCTLLALASLNNWDNVQFDVHGAYLYGNINTVYMQRPVEILHNLRGKALNLCKALSGM